jgi:hypothetical protein
MPRPRSGRIAASPQATTRQAGIPAFLLAGTGRGGRDGCALPGLLEGGRGTTPYGLSARAPTSPIDPASRWSVRARRTLRTGTGCGGLTNCGSWSFRTASPWTVPAAGNSAIWSLAAWRRSPSLAARQAHPVRLRQAPDHRAHHYRGGRRGAAPCPRRRSASDLLVWRRLNETRWDSAGLPCMGIWKPRRADLDDSLMDRAAQRRRTMSRCQRRMVSGVTSSRSPGAALSVSRRAGLRTVPGPPSPQSCAAVAGRRAGGAGSRSRRSSTRPHAGTAAATGPVA